jgi:hypothetical protein
LSFEFCDKDTIFFAKLFIFVLPFINTNEELAKRSLCHDAVDALSCPLKKRRESLAESLGGYYRLLTNKAYRLSCTP